MLKSQLEDLSARIIITTIQKLSTFIKSNPQHPVYQDNAVIIFEECHRSRFGDKLHTYTIVDAITDKNVLPFRIDYLNTVQSGEVDDKEVHGIDAEAALLDPQRISQIVSYILKHYDQKTKRSSSYEHSVVLNVSESTRARKAAQAISDKRRVNGFNALLATASIDAARRYYGEFERQQRDLSEAQRLKVGVIYSYGANEAAGDGIIDDEAFDTDALSKDAREFLEDAIQDYNQLFGTSYDTSADKFQNYYKDLSQRLKNRELDLVIVVNMFLTGFDATTMNTLFVDKNLKAHGLIQAYSRTNRILNSVKTYGNIVCFRNLEKATNEALELFGNREARGVVLLKPYAEYYAEYAEKVATLLEAFPLDRPIIGESAQRDFVQLFGLILRLDNILSSFDDFAGNQILTERQMQDYHSHYLDLHQQMRQVVDADKERINEDLIFEIELIKQVEVNVDYILMLVEEYREHHGDGKDKEIKASISRAVDSSPTLRNKKDLIEAFVDSVSIAGDVDSQWEKFILARLHKELDAVIEGENLRPAEAKDFLAAAFRDDILRTSGTAITKVLPPVSRFAPRDGHGDKKRRVTELLSSLFERFRGLVSTNDMTV